MGTADFLIVGGGVIGMMTAWQLAEADYRVTLLEHGRCGREASWAGGGIMSPLYPWRYDEAITRLSRWAEKQYPSLVQRLAAETGIDPEYRQKGHLYLNVDSSMQAQSWARSLGKPLERMNADFIYRKEPHLAAGFKEALWMPTLGSIRNPRLCQALRAQLIALPRVEIKEGIEVRALRLGRDRRVAVDTVQGAFTADRTILCSGAWTAQLLAPLGVRLPVRPVKGQMMLFRTSPVNGRALLKRVVLMNGRYLIPRADGRLLIGSTLEDAEFDKSPTANARAALYQSAIAMVPSLADCSIEHHWAGLRPGAPDEMPFIGAVPGIDGLFVNAGHYRSGLVLAPAATRLLVDQLLERTPIVDPRAYDPNHGRAGSGNAAVARLG